MIIKIEYDVESCMSCPYINHSEIGACLHPKAPSIINLSKIKIPNECPEINKCTCHERDSSFICEFCKKDGYSGHMER